MLVFSFLLLGLMVTVIITDITRYIIPNWLVLTVFLLYPVMLTFTPHLPDWKMALLIAVGGFGLGFLCFLGKLMGGGDAKLLSALCLWTGKTATIDFVASTALLGGVLVLILLGLRPFTVFICARLKKSPTIPRVLTSGEPVPYGVAIAVAFILLLANHQIVGISF